MEIQSVGLEDCEDAAIINYSNMVYRLAFSYTRSKHDTEDIYQEVFLRYVRCNPEFENEEHRKAWLIRVTINCCKKLWASSWKRKVVPLEDTISFDMPEDTILYDELKKLPPKYRMVIHLFYYEDFSIEQISNTLGIKQSTIRTQLTRARNILKENLKGDFSWITTAIKE